MTQNTQPQKSKLIALAQRWAELKAECNQIEAELATLAKEIDETKARIPTPHGLVDYKFFRRGTYNWKAICHAMGVAQQAEGLFATTKVDWRAAAQNLIPKGTLQEILPDYYTPGKEPKFSISLKPLK